MADRSASRTQLASVGASTIRASDLSRIKSLVSGDSAASRRKASSETAAARRARMIAIDEARMKSKAESGVADAELQRALEKRLAPFMAEHDVAKTMRTQAARAEALHGRQIQIAEKRRQAAAEREEERRFHESSMRDLARAAEADHKAKVDAAARRRDAADHLQRQLHAREMDRILEQERQLLEARQAKAAVDRAEEAEQKKQAMRRFRTKEAAAACAIQNEQHAKRKEYMLEVDREETRRVMEYQAEKARQETEAEERAREEKATKAAIHAAMLAAQEKEMDTRGEEDAARALVHEEALIMKERIAERRKEEKRRQRVVEIKVSQTAQRRLREAQRAAERTEEARQVEIFKDSMASAAASDDAKALAKRRAALENAELVKRQVAANGLRAKAAAKEVLHERAEQAMVRRAEATLLAQIQAEAVSKLEKRHVDARFVKDVAKMRVDV